MSVKETEIYAACVSSYNSGKLVGGWVSLEDQTLESLQEEILELIEGEEWSIDDYKTCVEWKVGQYSSLADLLETYEMLCRKEDELGEEGFQAALEQVGLEDIESVESASLWDDSMNMLEDLGFLEGIPESAMRYIDFDGWARDICLSSGSLMEHNGGYLLLSE